ncbi:hypothetical protein QUB56_18505 [Microcoleus sp. AR_TQ3_B6]
MSIKGAIADGMSDRSLYWHGCKISFQTDCKLLARDLNSAGTDF